jgi:hypothetical protein
MCWNTNANTLKTRKALAEAPVSPADLVDTLRKEQSE